MNHHRDFGFLNIGVIFQEFHLSLGKIQDLSCFYYTKNGTMEAKVS